MSEIFLTYDIRKTTNTIHTELKNKLISHYGYVTAVNASDGKTYYLPNTTLGKVNTDTKQASSDFLNACRDVGAIWEKYIAIERVTWIIDNQNP